MSKITLKTDNCKACGNCVRNCRQGALRFTEEVNAKGYRMVAVDEMQVYLLRYLLHCLSGLRIHH